MKVKICGITNLYIAEKAVEYGADALGFVFANSSRQITLAKAKEIIAQLKGNVLKVGVFVNEDVNIIRNIMNVCELDFVQLHGDEDYQQYESFSDQMIKAFSIKSDEDLNKACQYESDYILLDSARDKYFGGSGKSFDWSLINQEAFNNKKIILAGGLNKDNVLQAIKMTKPYMVDVSSGVESNGEKDLHKIKQFIDTVKNRRGEFNE